MDRRYPVPLTLTRQSRRRLLEPGNIGLAFQADKINHEKMNSELADGTTMAHDDPNSVILEPQAIAEIIWKFTEAVNLEFACNIPSHYEAGMAGKFQLSESTPIIEALCSPF